METVFRDACAQWVLAGCVLVPVLQQDIYTAHSRGGGGRMMYGPLAAVRQDSSPKSFERADIRLLQRRQLKRHSEEANNSFTP